MIPGSPQNQATTAQMNDATIMAPIASAAVSPFAIAVEPILQKEAHTAPEIL